MSQIIASKTVPSEAFGLEMPVQSVFHNIANRKSFIASILH